MSKKRTAKVKWIITYGEVCLPERRPFKPMGRIILFGKELSAQETVNYCKAMRVT